MSHLFCKKKKALSVFQGLCLAVAVLCIPMGARAEEENPGGNPGGPQPGSAISFLLEGDGLDETGAIVPGTVQAEYSVDGGTVWTAFSQRCPLDETVTAAHLKITYDPQKYDVLVNGMPLASETMFAITTKGDYRIQIDKKVCTVTWAFDDRYGEDGKIEHGTIAIISAVKPGETGQWSGIEPAAIPGINNNKQDDLEGRVAIIPGSLVTVKILPDYGYQFVSGSLNGNVVTAGSEVGVFTFVMPATNLHVSALFAQHGDQIDVTASEIKSATIADGANVVSTGNLKLQVAALTPNAQLQSNMEQAAGTASIEKYISVDLSNVVNKGNESEVWETPLSELTSPVSISLTLDESLQDENSDYTVIREHEGVYTAIPATYDAATGTLTFATDRFSEYAIAKTAKQGSSEGNSGTQQNNPGNQQGTGTSSSNQNSAGSGNRSNTGSVIAVTAPKTDDSSHWMLAAGVFVMGIVLMARMCRKSF